MGMPAPEIENEASIKFPPTPAVTDTYEAKTDKQKAEEAKPAPPAGDTQAPPPADTAAAQEGVPA